MVFYYFGADHTWENLQQIGFNRRNTCILKALANDKRVIQVYNIRKVSAHSLLKHLQQKTKQEKVIDILYAPLVPTWIIGSTKINRWLFRTIVKLQTNQHNERILLWCYWPRAYEQINELGLRGEIIFDADHNLIDDPNLPEQKKDDLCRKLELIARQADIVVSASRSMNRWFRNKGAKRIYRLLNGVDLNRFVFTGTSVSTEPKKIGYVGTLSKWIDAELLLYLISARPEYNFMIVGADFKTTISEQIANKNNVEWLGRQPADRVPALMRKMKVGLSLYRQHADMDADSMKVYEYLAAGLTVVATRYHKSMAEDYNSLLSVADSYDDFLSMLDEQMESTSALDKEAVTSFLSSATWQSRVSAFISKLEAYGSEN